MTSFQDKLDALPEIPEPPFGRAALVARLALAREYKWAHKHDCLWGKGAGGCECGLNAFRAKLDSEGI